MRKLMGFWSNRDANRRKRTRVSVPVLLLTTIGCSMSALSCAKAPAQSAAPPPPPPPPPAEHIPPPVDEKQQEPSVRIIADAGFETPESIHYDKRRDVYLVSNINGAPLEKDGNGFISKVTPDGKVTAKFIDGASEGITLNAPKGLTISGDTLYVADIDHVRMFDARTGLAKGEVEFKGATFLNGLATGKDGLIYVSDSGLDKNFESNGSDAVYLIEGKTKKTLVANEQLGGPNGLVAAQGGVWVTTFRSGELYWISNDGKIAKKQRMPKGRNDGLVVTNSGRFLVSSWEESAVFSGTPGSNFQTEISGVESPADLGYDCERDRVLIPLFKKNAIVLHTLATPASPAED